MNFLVGREKFALSNVIRRVEGHAQCSVCTGRRPKIPYFVILQFVSLSVDCCQTAVRSSVEFIYCLEISLYPESTDLYQKYSQVRA